MPYIILVLGILVGLYALYRFFMVANVAQIRAAFYVGALLVVLLSVFVLALTGRLPAAAALLGALVPLALGYIKGRPKADTPPAGDDADEDD